MASAIDEEFISLLAELRETLGGTEPRWAELMTYFESAARSSDGPSDDRALAQEIRSVYAGMGSFSDVVLQDGRGVLPAHKRLDQLRRRLYDRLPDLVR